MISPTFSRPATLALAVALAAPAAMAQPEFLMYPCDAGVSGTIIAEAHLYAAGHGNASDQDAASLAGTFTPPFAYPFAFGSSVNVAAAVHRAFTQNCCPTQAGAEVEGSTRYGFTGEQYWMSFETASGRAHGAYVTRGPLSCGPGDFVSADSLYYMPHSDNYYAEIPFVVGGGDGATMVVTDFVLSRTDSGPSGGGTYLSWNIVIDSNSDCVQDLQEPLLASGWGSVGPNQRVRVPDQRFAIPRGYYILQIYHRPYSYLGVASSGCEESVSERSQVDDTCRVRFVLE